MSEGTGKLTEHPGLLALPSCEFQNSGLISLNSGLSPVVFSPDDRKEGIIEVFLNLIHPCLLLIRISEKRLRLISMPGVGPCSGVSFVSLRGECKAKGSLLLNLSFG